MEIFLKVTAGILITVILNIALSQKGTEISLVLTVCVCCMVVITAFVYLQPVLDFMNRLVQIGTISSDLMRILLKVAGIGIVAQIAELICNDAGNQSLGKALQVIVTAVVLCISIPLFEELLSLIETALGST